MKNRRAYEQPAFGASRRASVIVGGLVLVLTVGALAGCASRAPVSSQGAEAAVQDVPGSGVHVVARGETLYRIAAGYGVDWRSLASANGIRAPYTIHPGQRIQLRGVVPQVASRDAAPAPQASGSGRSAGSPPVARREASSGARAGSGAGVSGWQWPADGEVIRRFSASQGTRRGIGIAGERGAPVRAAADGEVVYAGSGLVGYGRLIILKHDVRHLSAYAHNDELLVEDGDRVKAGQTVARMGSSGTDRVQLHFEIRSDGQPIDPLQYLPGR